MQKIIVLTGRLRNRTATAVRELFKDYKNAWIVEYDYNKQPPPINQGFDVAVIDKIPSNEIIAVVNQSRRVFRSNPGFDFILVSADNLTPENIEVLKQLNVEVRVIAPPINNQVNFTIKIPKDFLHEPDPKLDFMFELHVVAKTTNGERFLIHEITGSWAAQQYVNFNAKGLDDYLIGAAKNAYKPE